MHSLFDFLWSSCAGKGVECERARLDSTDTIDDDQQKPYIDLDYFIPDAPGVHVIITSRSSTAKEMTTLDAVEVADMEPSEAIEVFQRCAKIKERGQDIVTEVAQIVKELGHLALAITLAGSYVSETPRLSSDIRRYLPEYRERRKELLRQRAKRHIHQYGESVLSTWEASFEAIENHNPGAARLLSLLAFVNFEDIFLGLFDGDGAGVLASALNRVAEPPEARTSSNKMWQSFLFSEQQWTVYELESAFETLQSYFLIQWKADQKSYAMHKLVHAWGQDRLEADGQRQLSSLALELMADAIAKDQIDPSHQLRLVPHVMASFGMFCPLHESLDELAMDRLTMIDGMEDFLFRIGRWSEAYKMQVFHLRKTEKMLGKEHPSTLGSMNNLAEVLSSQGKYEKAEEMHRQALALRERVLGKEHPSTLTSMNNLALVLNSQGNYEEAEEMYRQVLALRERVLSKGHTDMLGSMNNFSSDSQRVASGSDDHTVRLWDLQTGVATAAKHEAGWEEVSDSTADLSEVSSVQSLPSLVSDSSLASMRDKYGLKAAEHLGALLSEDSGFTSMYEAAMAKYSRERFHSNHDQLLKAFFKDLRSETQNPVQLLTIRSLRSRDRRHETTLLIHNNFKPLNVNKQQAMTILLLLRKAFSAFPVNLTTSLAGNGRGNILKTSTSISLNLLFHFWIPLSRLPCTSILHFWNVPRVLFLEPSPKTKFQFWPPSLRSDSGTGRVGTPPDSLGSSPEVYTP